MKFSEYFNSLILEEYESINRSSSYARRFREEEYEYEYEEEYESSVSEEDYLWYKRKSYELMEKSEVSVFYKRRDEYYRYYEIKARLEREEAAIY